MFRRRPIPLCTTLGLHAAVAPLQTPPTSGLSQLRWCASGFFTDERMLTTNGLKLNEYADELYQLVRGGDIKAWSIHGPPGSGKTALCETAARRHPGEMQFHPTVADAVAEWQRVGSKLFFQKINLIDDAQVFNPCGNGAHEAFLVDGRAEKNSTVFTGFFTRETSPVSQQWIFLDGVFANSAETAEWFQRGLRSVGCNDSGSFVDYCVAATNNHAPLLNKIGESVSKLPVEDRSQLLKSKSLQVKLVHDSIKTFRLFEANGLNEITPEVEGIVRRLTIHGSATVGMIERGLVSGGLFTPVTSRSLEFPAAKYLRVVQMLEYYGAVQLAHPLQWALCPPIHKVWLGGAKKSLEDLSATARTPSIAIDVLLATLPCIRPDRVHELYGGTPAPVVDARRGGPHENPQRDCLVATVRDLAARCSWKLDSEPEPLLDSRTTPHKYDWKVSVNSSPDFHFEFLSEPTARWDGACSAQKQQREEEVKEPNGHPTVIGRPHAGAVEDGNTPRTFVGAFAERHLRWELPAFNQSAANRKSMHCTVGFLAPSFPTVTEANISSLEEAIDVQRTHLKKVECHQVGKGGEGAWCLIHFVSHTNLVLWYKHPGTDVARFDLLCNGVLRRYDANAHALVDLHRDWLKDLAQTEAVEAVLTAHLRFEQSVRDLTVDEIDRLDLNLPAEDRFALHNHLAALKPVEAYYVFVTLPSHDDPIVIDVAHVLKKEGLPKTIDGLRVAVKKELENTLKDYGISALVVYGPGEKKEGAPHTKVSTPLQYAQEEKPYHVEVSLPDVLVDVGPK
jgi:hypothetical protein